MAWKTMSAVGYGLQYLLRSICCLTC